MLIFDGVKQALTTIGNCSLFRKITSICLKMLVIYSMCKFKLKAQMILLVKVCLRNAIWNERMQFSARKLILIILLNNFQSVVYCIVYLVCEM